MKKLLTLLMFSNFLLSSPTVFAQVGIGTSEPNPKAMLDVKSTEKGFLPPRMTEAQRDAIQNPPDGLIIYNTDENRLNLYTGKFWKPLLYNEGSKVNQMLYWNGNDWEVIPPPKEENQVLIFKNGMIQWELSEEKAYPGGYVHCNGTPTEVKDVISLSGVTWMDRNLGASRKAMAMDDELAYGDLFQWGRFADGHQCRTSATTDVLSTTDQPLHGKFIIMGSAPEVTNTDWRSVRNDNLWQGASGINNPCPAGYRIPTKAELDAERLNWSSNNTAGAFASPLAFPTAGARNASIGVLSSEESGLYHSSDVVSTNSWYLVINSMNASVRDYIRATGKSVRCIKN